MTMIIFVLFCVLVGMGSGILSGLLGLGGGIIIVPALGYYFKWQQWPSQHIMHVATGTSLAIVMVTTGVSAWSHYKRQSINKDILRVMIPGMVVGSCVGVFLGGYLSTKILKDLFALFCIILSLRLLYATIKEKSEIPAFPSRRTFLLTSTVAGVLAGMLGIGGGAIIIPLLIWLNMPMVMVSGTSAACAFPTALTGTIASFFAGHHAVGLPAFTMGFVYWPAVLITGLSSMVFAPIGVYLSHRWSEKIVKRIFAVLLMAIAYQMAFNGLY